MENSIEIRLATPDDSETLARIMIAAWHSAFRGILSDDTIEQYTQFEPCAAMFSQILESGIGTMYLAELDSQPMGLLYWLPESQEDVRIEALLTIPKAWGKGIGAALMEQVLLDAKAAGYSTVHVWPFSENHRAKHFYEKFGFQATGRTRMGDALELEYVIFLSYAETGLPRRPAASSQ